MPLHTSTPSSAEVEGYITDLKKLERGDEIEAAAKEAEAQRTRAQARKARTQAQRSTRNRKRGEKMIECLREWDEMLVENKRRISELEEDQKRVSGEKMTARLLH